MAILITSEKHPQSEIVSLGNIEFPHPKLSFAVIMKSRFLIIIR